MLTRDTLALHRSSLGTSFLVSPTTWGFVLGRWYIDHNYSKSLGPRISSLMDLAGPLVLNWTCRIRSPRTSAPDGAGRKRKNKVSRRSATNVPGDRALGTELIIGRSLRAPSCRLLKSIRNAFMISPKTIPRSSRIIGRVKACLSARIDTETRKSGH